MTGKWKTTMYLIIETKSMGLINCYMDASHSCALSDNFLSSIYSSLDLSWSSVGSTVKEKYEV